MGYVQLRRERAEFNAEPQCLWRAGGATKDFTAMPESPYVTRRTVNDIFVGMSDKRGLNNIFGL